MTLIAPTLQAFFADHLARARACSQNTIASYRDAWTLFLGFVSAQNSVPCSRIDFAMIDSDCLAAFLDWLETERGSAPKTRNLRLTAIRSLLAYAAPRHPEHADTIARALSVPPKKHDRPELVYLSPEETDALVAAPDTATPTGRRDKAMLALAAQTGLRISELANLRIEDVDIARRRVSCVGKGRKHRATPMTKPVAAVMGAWMEERATRPGQAAFPNREGGTLSRDAIEHRLAAHLRTASKNCPSLAGKHVTMHALRRTAAMRLLEAGVDIAVIALFLGHESTATTLVYLHADMKLKQTAVDLAQPISADPGRYKPGDPLLAWLKAL
ncbi:MAG: site-specific integrase [Bifidobacteriaceae bacterium]|jgi:site-specific recombinase XerD|nr:site-specific integrase [Bifidobacteriaceae bacterium]